MHSLSDRNRFLSLAPSRQNAIRQARDMRASGDGIRWIDWLDPEDQILIGLTPSEGVRNAWIMVTKPC
ncbi:hypothetical protein H0H87_003245, partial [Tephrocybe sp. NHM501043]